MTYMAALTMLDWCLLRAEVPTVQTMLSSVVWQPMSGINSAHKAKLRALEAHCAGPTAQQPASVTAESASSCSKARDEQQHTARQLLLETVAALLRSMVVMDALSAILQCSFCYGNRPMLQFGATSTGSSGPPIVAAWTLHHLFKGAAGFLLGMQLAASYMMGRIVLILFGFHDVGPVHIFDKPWMATSISDLWSNRWHQVLRFYFTGLGYSLADKLSSVLIQWVFGLRAMCASHSNSGAERDDYSSSSSSSSSIGEKGRASAATLKDRGPKQHLELQPSWQWELRKTVRTLVVFGMSGVVHEYVVWAAFGVLSGKHLAFFMSHGAAVLAEGFGAKLVSCPRFCGVYCVPLCLRRAWVLGFALVTCPLFVDVLLDHRHYQDYVPPFIVPVTAATMERLGLCKCA
jgi:hypothetical protein